MFIGIGTRLRSYLRKGQGPIPPPPAPGPMEWAVREKGLTSASKNFDLAAPDMDMGFTARFTGTPVFSATHGGEALEVFVEAADFVAGIVSLIIQGRGLTIENKEVVVSCTGGTFGPFAAYMNEVFDPENDNLAWKEGITGTGNTTPMQVIDNSYGGIMRSIYGNVIFSTGTREYRPVQDNVTDTVGALAVGDEIPDLDFSPTGWDLTGGWVVDPDDPDWMINTGGDSYQNTLYLPSASTVAMLVDVEIPDGAFFRCGTNQGTRTYDGPYTGQINNASEHVSTYLVFRGSAGVRVKFLAVEKDAVCLTYIVGSSPTVPLNKSFQVYSGAGNAFALASRQVIAPPQPEFGG